LFHGKHVLVELLLKFFICIVDAELFEGVFLEDLETEDIEQANEFYVLRVFCIHLLADALVDSLHEPVE